MICLQMNGFLADNLFQYTVARILAEELGYALHINHSRMHPRRNVPQLEALLAQCRDAPLALPGLSFEQPVEYSACIGHEGFDGFHLDLPRMFASREPRKIMLAGYFQRYEIFKPYKHRIRAWFDIAPLNMGFDIHPDDIVLHIRMGDFVVFGRAISLGFYTDLLDTLQFRKLYICGYGLGAEVRKRFARYNPTYVHGEPVDDFRFMKGFNRMIMSTSGFSWWAAFLSDAQEIYMPLMAENGKFSEPKSLLAELRVDDEPRYRVIHDVPYLERSFNFKDIVLSSRQLTKRRLLHSVRRLVAERFTGGQ